MKSIDENQKRNRVEIRFAVNIWSLKKRQNGSVASPRYSCFTVIRSRQARLIISTHISTQMEELQKIGSIRLSKGTVWFLCFTISATKRSLCLDAFKPSMCIFGTDELICQSLLCKVQLVDLDLGWIFGFFMQFTMNVLYFALTSWKHPL